MYNKKIKKHWSLLSKVIFSIFIFSFCCMVTIPAPLVIEGPGPAVNVLGKYENKQIITIDNNTDESNNKTMLMTTVSVMGGPNYPAPLTVALYRYFNPSFNIIPQEAVYGVNVSGKEIETKNKKDMTDSTLSSKKAAFSELKTNQIFKNNKSNNIDIAKIQIEAKNIGGPSAGLMFSLGIIEKLTNFDLANGKTIAGTGTINNNGEVGPIGGIKQKMIGAKLKNATLFLAPSKNCNEVIGNIPAGLEVIKVSTLKEALKYLIQIKNGEPITNEMRCNL